MNNSLTFLIISMISIHDFPELATYLVHFYIFLSDMSGGFFILLKIYRALCITKLTFDQLPLFNPYSSPLAAIRVLTQDYFGLWAKFLPPFQIGSISYDLSSVLALELLFAMQNFLLEFRYAMLRYAVLTIQEANLPFENFLF